MKYFLGRNAIIGKNCKIQEDAFIPDNVIIEDNVFIAPHVVFCNDKYPPSNGKWKDAPPTRVKSGASIGANTTILPSITIGENAMVGAGSVVTKDIPDGATAFGNPARYIERYDFDALIL